MKRSTTRQIRKAAVDDFRDAQLKQVGLAWSAKERKDVDKWISANGRELTFAQAIHRLVELGLKAKDTQ